MTSATWITRGNVSFDRSVIPLIEVFINGQHLGSTLPILLERSNIPQSSAFDKTSRKIELDNSITGISHEIFKAVKIIKEQDKDGYLAAILASHLFERFTPYWRKLLEDGQDIIGIQLWQNLLSMTYLWEKNSKTNIHKGTPYFFLAESYLLVGERDLGFIYLYNALQEDIILGSSSPQIKYPQKAPSFLTATMIGEVDNQMYYLVLELRQKLDAYISLFNNLYPRSIPFTSNDFDNKFLANSNLIDVVFFFVFNFLHLSELEKNTQAMHLQNQFSRLRTLDTIFNLCLVIDETLRYAQSKKVGLNPNHRISDGILWLVCDHRKWMSRDELIDFWGPKNLYLNDVNMDLDKIIPRLLSKKETYNGRSVRREIFDLLMAYKLRNYTGHNIKQQNTVNNDYNDIIRTLVICLFLCVDAI
jgi:hypothetical protein